MTLFFFFDICTCEEKKFLYNININYRNVSKKIIHKNRNVAVGGASTFAR